MRHLDVDVETEETILPSPKRPISLPFLFASKAGSITDFSSNIIDLGPATVCFQSKHPSSFSFTSSEQKSGIFGVVWNSGWLAIFRTSTSSSNAQQFHQPSLLFSVNTFTTLFSLRLSGLWLLATDYTGKTFLLNVKSCEAEFESKSKEYNNGNFFFVFDSSRMLGPGAVKLFSTCKNSLYHYFKVCTHGLFFFCTVITARITVPPPPEGLGEEPAEMGALNAIEGDSIVYVKFTGRIGVVSKFKTHLENLGPALK